MMMIHHIYTIVIIPPYGEVVDEGTPTMEEGFTT